MKKESLFLTNDGDDKDSLRAFYKERLKALSLQKRKIAKQALYDAMLPLIQNSRSVLSFVSTSLEIDTQLVNEKLCTLGKLYLPATHKDQEILELYKVENLSKLIFGPYKILEPDRAFSSLARDEEISCILVPARSFDAHYNRLGRGKGHYDKLIDRFHKQNLFPRLIGIGFTEQLSDKKLPSNSLDKKVEELLLF